MCSLQGRSCHVLRVVQILGISGDPSGDICNHQEASRKNKNYREASGIFWQPLKINLGRQVVCLQPSFPRVLWAVWVGASWNGAPVFDHQQLPRCGRGARAV